MNVSTGQSGDLLEAAQIKPSASPEKTAPTSPPLSVETIVIQPGKKWTAINFRELWAYRELFYFLIWRDVKVRYKQTLLGVVWALLQPLFSMLMFTVLMSRLAHIGSDNIPYPIFAYSGLLLWLFFSNAISNSGNSLITSTNLITKVYFPRLLILAASVAAGLVDFGVAFLLLMVLMVLYRVSLSWQAIMLVPLLLLTTLLATGVGMWLSAINVKYRDIRYALPFFIQLWMYASPVIYPPSLLGRWKWVLVANPLTGIIDNLRSALFGRPFHWPALGVSTAITVAMLIYATYVFRNMEKTFADIV